MEANRKRVLITGSTGFVGRHLCRRLLVEGWEIHVLVRSASDRAPPPGMIVHRWHGEGIELSALVADARPDLCIHLASQVLTGHVLADIEPLMRANVVFPCQLLECLESAGCRRFIDTGTAWQHFQGESNNPVCLYAATKQAFSDLLAYWIRAKFWSVITLKLHDTYGPKDERSKLLPTLLAAAHSGRTLEMSPGEQLIDLVHIDDVVGAYVLAAKRLFSGLPGAGEEECYPVTSGSPIRLRDLVESFRCVTGMDVRVAWGGRPYRDREVMSPWSERRILPGWEPRIELQEGLATLLEGGERE